MKHKKESMMAKIVIIGGVAGGATVAARLRRVNEQDEIIILERDEYISYANCGLPYYIGGVIEDRDNLLVQTIENMSLRYRLDIRNFSEVVGINSEEKTVTVFDKKKEQTYYESYDKLIISTGANSIIPEMEGIENSDCLFSLRTISDADKMKKYILENNPKKAIVVGGGFIGIEIAENLVEKGIKVTLVEKMNQVLRILDYEMAQVIHKKLNDKGVDLLVNERVIALKEKGHKAVLTNGEVIDTDLVILGIGVAPENNLAASAGIELGAHGHIVTNNNFQTINKKTGETYEDIFAIGDVIQVKDRIDGSMTAIPLAWPANRQARLLADYINGKEIEYKGTLGACVLKVFDLTVATTGNTEELLKSKGIQYTSISAHRYNHASYYPGSEPMNLKILYSPLDQRILGAQCIGKGGAEKRIDVINTVIALNGRMTDLSGLELCYAPPYSSAKDPVNILGYIAENLMAGDFKMVDVKEIDQALVKGGLMLDVRTSVEFSLGKIKGAYNIPLDELRDRIGELEQYRDQNIYVTCQVGLRAHIAIMILKGYGFKKLYNLSGGYLSYRNFKYIPERNVPFKGDELDVDQQIPAPKVKSNGDMGENIVDVIKVNAKGLQCPGPLMATYKAVQSADVGTVIEISATDYGFTKDVVEWCRTNYHKLISIEEVDNGYKVTIKKGVKPLDEGLSQSQENATIVVFSGELDKAIAAMIIAQGAVASGKKVTIFFTFWGLNALRKSGKVKTKKNFIEFMFGKMMPKGARKLPLSSMNMLGVGPKMIKYIMKSKNVDDIELMIKKSMELGVDFIACTMSMELMGIKKEELIEGIEYAGVGAYISANENVGTTLFI